MPLPRIIKIFRNSSALAYIAASLGSLFFVFQLFKFAHTQTSFVDEGMYLYLGYKFVTGGLAYQNLGLWNYYAPLSYFISGIIQTWFGPGLRVARYFSIFLGIMMLFPLWLTVRRIRGNWWAALLVWVIALMPIQSRILSLGLSQSLVGFFVGWSLFFVLGEGRTTRQIVIGSLISGILVMTRQNMLPFLPLLVIYVFWQNGRKAGLFSLVASLMPIIFFHLVFWPNILRLWSFYWLPSQWFPFLGKYGPPINTDPLWRSVHVSFLMKITAFFWGFRAYYIPFLGVMASLLLWPARRKDWKCEADFRASLFLGILFLSLFSIHLWASIIGTIQCTYCFIPYNAFYSSTALLLAMISYPSWVKKISIVRTVVIIFSLLIIASGLGLATSGQFGDLIIKINIPRLVQFAKTGIWQNGYPLGDILENRFGLEYQSARLILPPIISLILGGLLIAFLGMVKGFLQKRKMFLEYTVGSILMIVFLLIGLGISPMMGTAYREKGDCSIDVLRNYEKIGTMLNELIPEGSNIYWNVDSAVPLLYLPDVYLHPAQIFGIYAFRYGGDPDEVEESGYWNDSLALKWLGDADFLIVQENLTISPSLTLGNDIDISRYNLSILPPVNPCDVTSRLFIYKVRP